MNEEENNEHVEQVEEVQVEQAEKPSKPETPAWVGPRLATITAERNAYKEENDALRAELEVLKEQKKEIKEDASLSKVEKREATEDVNTRAQQIAMEMEFKRQCQGIEKSGREAFNDFDAKVADAQNKIGFVTPGIIDAVMDLDKPHEVIYNLVSNLDEYNRIRSMTPAKQGIALAKLASKKPEKKQVSDAPNPMKEVVGARETSGKMDEYNEKMPIGDWMKMRNKQEKEAAQRR